MTLNYNGLNNALKSLLVIPSTSPQWDVILPSVIDYAEGRIYKDMPFLGLRDTDTSKSFASGNRELTLPATMISVEQVAFNSSGTVTPLEPVSLAFINAIWPVQATTGTMKYWAIKNDTTIVVAGTPGAVYVAHLTGQFRPAAMASGNPTTYLGTNHPELLLAACMVFACGYQRDFGAQAADPQMAVSWESQYKTLLESAAKEEMRRRAQGQGA